MAVVQMYIEKFGGVVKINDDHPLAVAQRAKNQVGKPGLFDLPPEQREVSAVRDYLETLEPKALRDLAKINDVRVVGVKAEQVVTDLTVKLTSPAEPTETPSGATG